MGVASARRRPSWTCWTPVLPLQPAQTPTIDAGLNEFNAAPAADHDGSEAGGPTQDEQDEAEGSGEAAKKARKKEQNADYYYAKTNGPPLGADNTNRKSLDMPPVVGTTIQYSNKHLKYDPMPQDIDAVREKLFKADRSMLLNSQQIADYWPHMSNIWQGSTKPFVEANGCISEVWGCRNARRLTLAGKRKPGTGIRNRGDKSNVIAETEQCKIRIKLTFFTKHAENPKDPCGVPGFGNCKCTPDWLYIERSQPSKTYGHTHGHGIELCDKYKRSDALMYFAKLKVEESYSYSTVQKWLIDKYGTTAGMNYIMKSDIANVSRFWRMLNKDVELMGVIEDETSEEKQRKQQLDSINTTSAERLAKALTEVCKQIPEALAIAAPFFQQAEVIQGRAPPIVECDDSREISIPPPGLPLPKEVVYAYKRPSPPRDTRAGFPMGSQQQSTPQSGPLNRPVQRPDGASAAGTCVPRQLAPNVPTVHTSTARPPTQFNPPKVFVPQTQTGPPSAGGQLGKSVEDPMLATLNHTDPDATSRALMNTKPPENFLQPYSTGKKRTPAQPGTTQTTSYTTPWPPPSVSHPAREETPSTNGRSKERPVWAVVESKKRPPPAGGHEGPSAALDEPPSKRRLLDDISTQLRSELQASASAQA